MVMLAVVRGRRCKGKEWDYVRKEMTDEGMEKVEWGRKNERRGERDKYDISQ